MLSVTVFLVRGAVELVVGMGAMVGGRVRSRRSRDGNEAVCAVGRGVVICTSASMSGCVSHARVVDGGLISVTVVSRWP